MPHSPSEQAVPGFGHPDYDVTSPLDTDYYGVFADIPAADREIWQRARAVAADMREDLVAGWDSHTYPKHLLPRLGAAGLFNDGIEHPDLSPMSPLAAGLVNMELSRVDGSLGTMLAVQGGLGLRAVVMLGSAAQHEKYIGPIAAGDLLVAGAITEPDHGSDSVDMETTAARQPDGSWVLNGAKKWIGNGASGGITVVFARVDNSALPEEAADGESLAGGDTASGGDRADSGGRPDDHGKVRGFIVDQAKPGYSAEVIRRKGSLRAIDQALVTLTDVHLDADALMPGCRSFRDVSRVLWATRAAVAWSALGHATACFEASLSYARQRTQFGKLLGAHQLIQERLTRMLTDLVSMQLFCVRLTELDVAGKMLPTQAAMAKYHNTRTARSIAAEARDLLGGNGILLDNGVIAHQADIEAIHTYEGTESVQALLIGREVTGENAFA